MKPRLLKKVPEGRQQGPEGQPVDSGAERTDAEKHSAEPDTRIETSGRGERGLGRGRGRRRASLPAPAGSDPEPYDPPTERGSDYENDERLRSDRPPHWG